MNSDVWRVCVGKAEDNYLYQLCVNSGQNLDDLPGTMGDLDR